MKRDKQKSPARRSPARENNPPYMLQTASIGVQLNLILNLVVFDPSLAIPVFLFAMQLFEKWLMNELGKQNDVREERYKSEFPMVRTRPVSSPLQPSLTRSQNEGDIRLFSIREMVPVRYRDDLTDQVMTNPVQLPGGYIIDVSTCLRVAMLMPSDRQPLSIHSLEFSTELAKEIREWVEQAIEQASSMEERESRALVPSFS